MPVGGMMEKHDTGVGWGWGLCEVESGEEERAGVRVGDSPSGKLTDTRPGPEFNDRRRRGGGDSSLRHTPPITKLALSVPGREPGLVPGSCVVP